ncbi:hypothetical protein QR680_008727 [Steinernema hermaphroditum]|uniref:Saposin B-type domain-containing protein n=1 Tax=Steinernema hermaphroditum TaxID=289476 RepID=A0AA39IHP9_9BILA|nr:hypothetical protein QR680_008727 [Steinernema hermaphroditum]
MFVARGALLLLLSVGLVGAFSVEQCKGHLRDARKRLQFMAKNMVEKEHNNYKAHQEEFEKLRYDSANPTFALFADFDDTTPRDCPSPNATLPTKTPATNGEQLDVSSFSKVDVSSDPFALFVTAIHEILSDEEAVCNGPAFTSLATITEEQILGFASLFAVKGSHAFCPICHQTVDFLRTKVLQPNRLIHADDEVMFRKMVHGQLPSTMAICSTVLPSCYENYHINLPFNLTSNLTKCSACGVCMTATTLLEHKFLLDQKAVDYVHRLLNDVFFYNLCAEMCPKKQDIFQHFTFTGCMKTLNDVYTFGVKMLQRIALPNHLCALELGFCEPNATPNLLHCFPDFCQLDFVKEFLVPGALQHSAG